MNPDAPPRENGKRLSALLNALRETEREISGLRGELPATLVEGKQRGLLVRRAKQQRRAADVALQVAMLEALPAAVAVLDAAGVIIAVNGLWRGSGPAGAACGPGHPVGNNLVETCLGATDGTVTGRRVADGIRSILDASKLAFAIEYPWRFAAEERWSSLTVVPIDAGRPHGAVVMHVDVTATHVVAQSLLASANRFRQMAESIDDIFFLREMPGGQMVYVSPAYEKIWGRNADTLYANPASWIDAIHPEDRDAVSSRMARGCVGGRFAAEFRILRPDGSIRWIDIKGFPVRDDAGLVVRIAGIAADITERMEAAASLLESEARYRTLTEASFDAITVSQGGIILEVNAGFERLFGYSAAETVGRPATDFCAPESAEMAQAHASDDFSGSCDLVGLSKDGRKLYIDSTTKVYGTGADPSRITALRDVTERRHLEAQFRQAQKLDAVGRLAAGIAHDFNNQLSVIMAYASLVREDLGRTNPRDADIEEIQKAAMAAAALTRQLLVFSRQQVTPPRIVALETIVDAAEKMLRQMIGEDVTLVTSHGSMPATTLIDPGHVEQVIMNLAINARDAMPTGGTLIIDTRVVDLKAGDGGPQWPIVAGQFAMLSVTDTGIGMDGDTLDKIFEPFFSTKAPGAGTGLGLAVVYGIVRQCGGSIRVTSDPRHGACFQIYLPFAAGEAHYVDLVAQTLETSGGTESILLAEDSPSVRKAIRQMLEHFGYRVTEASTGARAVELAQGNDEIDLLLTDVIMPEMSGRVLAERIGALRPGLRVLFMSGYTDDAILRHGISSSTVKYIEKPFTPDALARKVRDALGPS